MMKRIHFNWTDVLAAVPHWVQLKIADENISSDTRFIMTIIPLKTLYILGANAEEIHFSYRPNTESIGGTVLSNCSYEWSVFFMKLNTLSIRKLP